MGDKEASQVRLGGISLRAAVTAAETPGAGEVVKRTLSAQLGLDELFALDLRDVDPPPAPATMPAPLRSSELADPSTEESS